MTSYKRDYLQTCEVRTNPPTKPQFCSLGDWLGGYWATVGAWAVFSTWVMPSWFNLLVLNAVGLSQSEKKPRIAILSYFRNWIDN